MDKITCTLTNLIKCALSGAQGDFSAVTQAEFSAVCSLAKMHGVLNVIYHVLQNLPNAQTACKTHSNAYNSAVFQVFNQEYYQTEIQNAFIKNKIKFLPLKGLRIRAMYPSAEMRTSSDVDIYIDTADLKKAKAVLQSLSFKQTLATAKEVSFFAPPYTTVELHLELDTYKNDNFYNDVWQRTETETPFFHQFDNTDFYVYTLVHMLKHFKSCGTGIRSVLDIYVLSKNLALDGERLNEQLHALNLSTFHQKIIDLANCYFQDQPLTPDLERLSDYIIQSGVYGNVQNRTNNSLSKRNGKFAYFLQRVFPSFSFMKNQYPVLGKMPFLLPFTYFARIFKGIFFKRKIISSSIKAIDNSNKSAQTAQKELFESLNIEF